MKRIVLTGGGTAGHVMPNVALLPYLAGNEIHYVGGSGMEKDIMSNYPNVIYHEIPCVKYARDGFFKNVAVPFKLIRSISNAKKVLKEIKPDVVFSKGGYVSLPVALAAGKTPLVTHESDLSLGLTNRLIAKKCKYVCCSFDVTAKKLANGVYTGAILRRGLTGGIRTSPFPTLLIMGGSLGSKALNECVFEALDTLTKRYNVIHVVGKGNLTDRRADGYKQTEFCSDMSLAYANADYIVSRGGANTLFEIAALNKKALIVPLPLGASRGDQIENAEYFFRRNVIRLLPQENLTSKNLLAELKKLESFVPEKFEADGTKKVASIILSV